MDKSLNAVHVVIVDRIEHDIAILLMDETPIRIPARLLPPGTKEGAHLTLTLMPVPAAETAARDRIRKVQQDLDRTGPVGENVQL